MSIKRSGLGRGLDALLPPKREGTLQQIDIKLLKPSPYQPRSSFDPEAVAELASSIAEKGILQPLLLRPAQDGYEIVAGERRYRAAIQAGLASVPAVIKELTDQETLELAIIENLQREDLNPLEEARAFDQLLAFGLSQEQVAQAVGKSRSAVANTLRLLKLPGEALAALSKGEISSGHARAILAQPAADQGWALEQVLSLALSVRQAEGLKRKAARQAAALKTNAHDHLEHGLARHLGTKVKVVGENKGKIELHFFSPDDLERLLDALNYQA